MAWYIIDPDEEFRPGYDPSTAEVSYGPFGTATEAKAFRDSLANRYFDEAHGPIVERPADTTECTGTQTIPTADGPDVAACTRRGCICKRYVPGQRGFTAAMLADIPDEEAW